MGIKTVAVFSDADMNSMFVREADEAYRIGPPPSGQSYLKMETILEVVKASGAQAVHPGYGFLSENSKFQYLLQENKVKFIGPPTKAILAMGDKIESKKLATQAGVCTVPGFLGEVKGNEEILKISREIGYPVMIKASAGGGGKGMRIAYNDKEALEGYFLSKEEAISSFGDGRIFIEKYIENPRHIEFQILGDEFGNYVYLPERECSVQRRNQKVIEEAPSSAMDPITRHKMGTQALTLAGACGYYSTGTVEFLMDSKKDFYFLEMNTRLQVEHPITEEISGVDLVEQQILIAAGHKLAFKQDDIKINGHSFEYRVYAEDPSRKFLPSIGFLRKYIEPKKLNNPTERVRIDTGVEEGSEISIYYDPLISKLVSWGPTREKAINVLDKAFDQYVIQGVTHNIGFGKSIIANENFKKGDYSTAFIPTFYPTGFTGDKLNMMDKFAIILSAHKIKNILSNQGTEKSKQTINERIFYIVIDKIREQTEEHYKVEQLQNTNKFQLTNLKSNSISEVSLDNFEFLHHALLNLDLDNQTKIIQLNSSQLNGMNQSFFVKGNEVKVHVYDATQYKYVHFMPEIKKIDASKMIISPMPGTVVQLCCQPGDMVVDGQQLIIIEAMKMQNIIKSEIEGKIRSVNVKSGESVNVDQLLIEFQ